MCDGLLQAPDGLILLTPYVTCAMTTKHAAGSRVVPMSTPSEKAECASASGGDPQNESKDVDVFLGVRSHQVDEHAPQGCFPIGAEPPPESPQLSAISQFVFQENSSLRSERPVLAFSWKDGDDFFGHPFRPTPHDRIGEFLEHPMMSLLVIENQLDQIPSSRGLCLLDEPLVALQKSCFLATVSVQCFYNLMG